MILVKSKHLNPKNLIKQAKTLSTKADRKASSIPDTSKIDNFQLNQKHKNFLYVWGLADSGALGIKNDNFKPKSQIYNAIKHPMRLKYDQRAKIIDIACGNGFSLLITTNSSGGETEVYGMGLNTDSQIGPHMNRAGTPLTLLKHPSSIDALNQFCSVNNISIVKCVAGRAHSVFLSQDGKVLTMGNNVYGQCGRPIIKDESYKNNSVIHLIQDINGESVESISCGQDHTVFQTHSGNLYSCGWSADGQTGIDDFECAGTPTQVQGDVKNEKIVKVACGPDSTLAINDKGECFGWGNAEYGQLGPDASIQLKQPRQLNFTKNCGKIIDVACAGASSYLLNEEGEVFVWGFGILGLGPMTDFATLPTKIPNKLFGSKNAKEGNRVLSITAGINHMAAINDKYELFMWGKNKHGCLGFGHLNDQYFPLKVAINAFVFNIQCGVDHSLALCRPFSV